MEIILAFAVGALVPIAVAIALDMIDRSTHRRDDLTVAKIQSRISTESSNTPNNPVAPGWRWQ